MKYFLFIIFLIGIQFQGMTQADSSVVPLPDLAFEKTIVHNGENEPIDIEIIVKNNGKVTSEPSILSINAIYTSLLESDIKRLELELIETDLSYKTYLIEYNVPVLKPNETATFKLKLDKKQDDDSYFLIRINKDKKQKESNFQNNTTAFPDEAFFQFNIFPDVVVKTIHEPEYNYEHKSTILRVDIENIGLATADSVTLEVWEITAAVQGLSERDKRAIFGEKWWLFEDKKDYAMFEFSEMIKELKAGEQKSFFIEFEGWIYDPNCKIGAMVKTTSLEDNTSNNASSFLRGG